MQTFKQYSQEQYKKAMTTSWFNAEGNSTLAIANRSFAKQLIKQTNSKGIVNAIKAVPMLIIGLIALVYLITLPISYPLGIIFNTIKVKISAREEIRKQYIQYIADQLHK